MALRRQHGPRFLWTGLMILGPVLALGVFGIWQLRRERAAAVVAAADEAELHARQVLAAGRFLLTDPEWPLNTPLDQNGEPLLAPLYPEVPQSVVSASPQALELRSLMTHHDLAAAERSIAAAQLAERSEGATASGLPLRPLAWRLALSSGMQAARPAPELRDLAEKLVESAPVSYTHLRAHET